MQTLKDKVALVTGSTGEGMGRSIAFTLAREGAKVVLNYGTGHPNNAHAAEKVLEELRKLGGKGYAFKADTRAERDVGNMVEGIITLYGRVDLLICNHGGEYERNDLAEINADHWRSVLQAEIDGLFFCVKHVLPHMRRRHFGRIIALSMARMERETMIPSDYHVGKSGRTALIRSIAVSEMKHNITCNVIAPGRIPHVTLRNAVEGAKHSTAWRRRTGAQPQDAAEVVRFLCSDEAKFVTGNVIELAAANDAA